MSVEQKSASIRTGCWDGSLVREDRVAFNRRPAAALPAAARARVAEPRQDLVREHHNPGPIRQGSVIVTWGCAQMLPTAGLGNRGWAIVAQLLSPSPFCPALLFSWTHHTASVRPALELDAVGARPSSEVGARCGAADVHRHGGAPRSRVTGPRRCGLE